jgi:hypothetical protein
MLPTTYEAAYAALSDVPRNTVYCCIRAMIGFKSVIKLEDGTLVANTPEPKAKVRRPHRVISIACGRGDDTAEPVKSALWESRPEQSPKVDCPKRGSVPMSTCLDDYTAAASGHKDGPAECAKCPVGRRRRMSLAWGAA